MLSKTRPAVLFPGPPGAENRTPVASLKLHREAPIDTVDPETVNSIGEVASTPGGRAAPRSRKIDADGEAPAFIMELLVLILSLMDRMSVARQEEHKKAVFGRQKSDCVSFSLSVGGV